MTGESGSGKSTLSALLVSEPMPEILAALWHGPMTADALLARLCELAEVEADAEALAARLGELEAIGLVSRA
jgi:PqqD family protein of HPr-rel-A system